MLAQGGSRPFGLRLAIDLGREQIAALYLGLRAPAGVRGPDHCGGCGPRLTNQRDDRPQRHHDHDGDNEHYDQHAGLSQGAFALGTTDRSPLAAPYPPLSRRHPALADRDERPAPGEHLPHARLSLALAAPSTRAAVAASRSPGLVAREASARAGGLALHSPLRGQLGRFRQSVLGRTPDGPLVPANLRRLAPAAQRDGGSLEPARADLGCRPRCPHTRLLAVAEHGA